MKLSDIKNLEKNDVLRLLGVETESSSMESVGSTLALFGLGALVGAAIGLLLAPKSGNQLRADLRERFEGLTDQVETAASNLKSALPNEKSSHSV